MNKAKDIDEFISQHPAAIQELLKQLRKIITDTAPDSKEIISYGMPAFKMNKILVYFAPGKHHIGFYPTSSAIIAFQNEFTGYKWSKGAIQFPLDKSLPEDLIRRIVAFRMEEDSFSKK